MNDDPGGIDWRFVGYGWAGYLFGWAIAGYIAVCLAVHGDSIDVRLLISTTLLFAPFGAAFGSLAAVGSR